MSEKNIENQCCHNDKKRLFLLWSDNPPHREVDIYTNKLEALVDSKHQLWLKLSVHGHCFETKWNPWSE